jgi:NADP-dependent 3-hydroxy acid dehydrogenase YdfG
MELEKKVFVITGASRGLGKYLCKHFVERGAKVAALARSAEKLEELKEVTKECNGELDYYRADVGNYHEIEIAVNEIKKKWTDIDVLINNAGVINSRVPFDQYPLEDLDAEIDTNLKGTIYCTRLISPIMMQKKQGYIINISSVAGTRGAKLPGSEVYVATKFGVNGFADSLSKYLIAHNIHVVTLCPGAIDTTIWERKRYRHGEDKSALIQPSEIANLIDLILRGRPNVLFKNIILFPTVEAQDW